ncbi:MAG: recombinase family protein [Anaeroplasma sp.]
MYREGMKCVIYVRVSTEMQVDGYSLDGQKNMLNKFAEREGLTILNVYEDAGKSGKSIEGRPAFKKMLFDIEKGLKVDYILVYKLSRFGRNAADILNSLEFIQDYDVNLLSVNEGLDSSQSTGKILISILSTMAEMERENIIEQTMNGRREKARQGGWNGGFAPYGYLLQNGKIEIDKEESEVIKMIFNMYAEKDMGIERIAKELNLKGIRKNPRPNSTIELWSRSQIVSILDNPIYTGKIAFGRRKREKVKGSRNVYKRVGTKDYILVDGEHGAIITDELWEKTQNKRTEVRKKYLSTCVGKERVHLLSGLLRCPECGGPMYANRANRKTKEVFYYQCTYNKSQRGRSCNCNLKIKKEDIEPYIIEFLKRIFKSSKYVDMIMSHIDESNDSELLETEKKEYEAKLKQIYEAKKQLEYEIDNMPLNVKHREEKIKDKNDRLDSIYDTIDELQTKINGINVKIASNKSGKTTKETIFKVLSVFDELYDKMTDEEKKTAISGIISDIRVRKEPINDNYIDEISISFNPSDDTFKPLTIKADMLDNWRKPSIQEDNIENQKITYKMIQEYIMNKYTLKISSNYIAEVKRNHGINMINDRTKEGQVIKYPCPKEKVLAIEDALRYYKVI